MREEGAVQGESGRAEPHCGNTERSHPGDSQEHTEHPQDDNKGRDGSSFGPRAGTRQPRLAQPSLQQVQCQANREWDVPGTSITQLGQV